MNYKMLWLSAILASASSYILYTELLGLGEILYLMPAGSLIIALIICLSMDPEAPRSFIRGLEEKVAKKADTGSKPGETTTHALSLGRLESRAST